MNDHRIFLMVNKPGKDSKGLVLEFDRKSHLFLKKHSDVISFHDEVKTSTFDSVVVLKVVPTDKKLAKRTDYGVQYRYLFCDPNGTTTEIASLHTKKDFAPPTTSTGSESDM